MDRGFWADDHDDDNDDDDDDDVCVCVCVCVCDYNCSTLMQCLRYTG